VEQSLRFLQGEAGACECDEADVGQFGYAAYEYNIGGFYVAMDQSRRMQARERPGERNSERDHLAAGSRPRRAYTSLRVRGTYSAGMMSRPCLASSAQLHHIVKKSRVSVPAHVQER